MTSAPEAASQAASQAISQITTRKGVAGLWRTSRNWPIIPLIIIGTLLCFAVFAPLIANRDPEMGNLFNRNLPPMWYGEFYEANPDVPRLILGGDPQGRDVYSRVVYGARISMSVAAIVLSTGGIVGTVIGLIAGYFGSNIDEILMRFVDLTFAVPFILVALVVVIVFGPSFSLIVILLIVFSWGGFARQVRGETLVLREQDYVSMAKVVGASPAYILYKHLLPGVFNTLMVVASLRVGTLILTEAVLSYLGVGIQPPTPAWGAMVADGRDYIATAWWLTFFPGLAIFLTVLAFNFLGDWLRDRLDPRLRQLG